MYVFSRIALFLVAVCGWAVLFFGGWIAYRGVVLYAADPVLMGTGGGLAVGGLLVVALTVGARAQVDTARDTHAMRALMESGTRPGPDQTPPAVAAAPRQDRAEPTLGRRKP
ncbi:hypothetical protein JANAI62_22140 [Jannaschia pagri]|uniref:Solute:sodium symporter small subunit n=2 Tax=Roseobacteraceae TaxID=2854170 RepID=A0ABQ4NMG0_9RHOB|nr:hypothetical protein JANAI61_22150 [Jannaschia sp. AI_61]GIT95591.1 hypothetical protein JANAI62_22140 [Jannaschia sp. AI_62]